MKKMKIKKDDFVRVIAGEDKGSEGKVLSVLVNKNKAIVENVNIVSKHNKPSSNNPQGGIVKKEMPVHISNIMLIDSKTKEITRIGFKSENGEKIRISKKSKEAI